MAVLTALGLALGLCACDSDAADGGFDGERPDEWMSRRKRCYETHGRSYCDGPRKIAKPHGEAAERAEQLELGTRAAATTLVGRSPKPTWVDAAPGQPHESLVWPVAGEPLGRGFGHVRNEHTDTRHDGLDITVQPGTEVRAVSSGIVGYANNGVRGMGNLVILVHPSEAVSLYAHLRAAYVFAGQRVEAGEVIGEVGNTGLSRGPHLHFEWRRNGEPRDPVGRFEDRPE